MKGFMVSGSLDLVARLHHGRNDIWIGGAATEIAAHIFPDLRLVAGMAFLDAGDRRHDLAGRAIAALKRVVVDEGLLHRMQIARWPGEPLYGRDLAPLCHDGEGHAGEDPLSVDMDCTGAAL